MQENEDIHSPKLSTENFKKKVHFICNQAKPPVDPESLGLVEDDTIGVHTLAEKK